MFIFLYNEQIDKHNKVLKFLNKYLEDKPEIRSNKNLKEIVIITKQGSQLFGFWAFFYIFKKILFKK